MLHDMSPIFDGPHYAVIFTSKSREGNESRYADVASEMETLAADQEGYLGIDSARTPGGLGISVSYWKDMDSIKSWREHAKHKVAQKMGKDMFYEMFTLRVALVQHGRWWTMHEPN